MTDTNTAAREALMDLIDAYAEARHVGGCHTYNVKTAKARKTVSDALTLATARWPNDASDVRAFIGSQFERLQYGKENGVPHENDRYTLTSHDLLSAFRWWSENLISLPEGIAGWTKASEQLPPCRGNQLYIGVNSSGFAGVFNAVTSIAGNVYCHYETPEESIDALGDLAIWQPFNPPIPASKAKEL